MQPLKSINRLLALEAFLRDVPRRDFNQAYWQESDESDETEPKCGTAACIGGWATHIVPELVLSGDGIYNKKTKSEDRQAFADAFGLSDPVSRSLVRGDAPHKTPLRAAAAVLAAAQSIADEFDYEISK